MPYKRSCPFKCRRSYKRRRIARRSKTLRIKRRPRTNFRRRRTRRIPKIAKYLFKKKQFTRMSHEGMTYLQGVAFTESQGLLTVPSGIIRANSIYDPNYSSMGGSFNGCASAKNFWGNIYNHYTVLGSKITYTLTQIGINGSSSQNLQMAWGVKLDNDAQILNTKNWMQLKQDPMVRCRFFAPDQNGGKTQSITMKFSTKKFFNTKEPTSDSSLYAGFNGNPTEQAVFMPWVQVVNVDGTMPTTYPSFTLRWKIDYFVALHEPKDVDSIPETMSVTQT